MRVCPRVRVYAGVSTCARVCGCVHVCACMRVCTGALNVCAGGSSDFTYSGLTGGIPITIGIANKLQWMSMARNNFDGMVPLLNTLAKLSYLDLNTNGFIGELTSLPTSLAYLNVQYNQFTGPVPAGLATLTKLSYL
ncbi:unnamed protein product, partial [Closterium sp. NIES-53]